MWIPMTRRFLAMTFVVLVFLGPWSARGYAQINPAQLNPATNPALRADLALNPAFNPALRAGLLLNPYVNPFAAQNLLTGSFFAAGAARGGALTPALATQTLMASRILAGRTVLASAGLTHPLAAMAGAGYGANIGMNVGARYGASMMAQRMAPYARMGYASMMNGGPMGGGMGGMGGMSGVLAASALSGAGYGYSMGLSSIQWMQNPYQGYLQGAADITRSNAQYYQTIQQAKLTRQEAHRSALQTRRAIIEEMEWEREHMPDPEKLRQQALERELAHARLSPPLTDIWTARSLNALLRNLITLQGDGTKGPDVPLDEDIVNHINVTSGDTTGNMGLLKNSADLDWPDTLQRGIFKESRENVNKLMETAYRSVTANKLPADATLADLQDSYLKMLNTYESHIKDFTPDEGIEAQRYLNEIKDTIKALKDPNVCNLFNEWKPKSKNVAELVRFMREKGLQFAPATEQDLAAYVALYNKLAAFDAAMPRVASTSSNFDNK
jgi:gas vesicle protein